MTSSGVRGRVVEIRAISFLPKEKREKGALPHLVQTTSALVRNETGRTLKF